MEVLQQFERWEESTYLGEGALRHYPECGSLYLLTAYSKRRFLNIEEAWAVLLSGERVLPGEALLHYDLACYECQLRNVAAAKESRGGTTTKIHVLADGKCRVLKHLLSAGNVADVSVAPELNQGLRKTLSG